MPVDDRDEALALPPHSAEAEQSVLGAMLLNNDVIDRVGTVVRVDDFYVRGHREVYSHIVALHEQRSPVDVVTLSEALLASGRLGYIGGMPYLKALLENVASAGNATHYAGIVRDRASLRALMAAGIDLTRAAASARGVDAGAILGEAREKLDALRLDAPEVEPTLRDLLTPVTPGELTSARLTPPCIVENYLYADVAVLAAPGGTGKTTLMLYEAVHIALGRRLYGLTVQHPGRVVVFTAEDSRELLVARLRHIVSEMQLSDNEIATVLDRVRLVDVTQARLKLTTASADTVAPSLDVDRIIAGLRPLSPVLVVFDPVVSFGVQVAAPNIGEQGLVEAARLIVRGTGAAVRFVHHVGKQNARDKTVDQYTSRGGSALPDGARMVTVLQPQTPEEWRDAAGLSLLDGENGLLLSRPKLSYAPPQPHLMLRRSGYTFSQVTRVIRTKGQEMSSTCDQVLRAIESEIAKGHYPTQNSLEELDLGPARKQVRGAVRLLLSHGRIEKASMPGKQKSGSRDYLQPATGAPGANGAAIPN